MSAGVPAIVITIVNTGFERFLAMPTHGSEVGFALKKAGISPRKAIA